MKHTVQLVGLLLLVTMLPLTVQAQGATWTVIYYSGADTDLEQFMIGDLMEMNLVGSTDQVNIVVQMDRVEGYDSVNGDWTDARRFFVTQAQQQASFGDFQMSQDAFIESLLTIDPAEFGMTQAEFENELRAIADLTQEEFEQFILQDAAPAGGGAPNIGIQLESIESLGEVNSGDPQTLIDFALWTIANYPAENYLLMISDHGGGWTGVVWDETDNNDELTMQDLDLALSTIIAESGIGKFEIVGFDACLMAQLEVMKTIAPYADYMLASQEVIPGAGWEYVTPLSTMVQNPSLSIPEFGQTVIDSYIYYYNNVLEGYDAFDLHLFDLSQVDALLAAVDDFSAAVQANPADNLRAIGNARNNAQLFGASGGEETSFTDLGDFMKLMQQFSGDANVQGTAQAVLDAIGNVVVYGDNTGEPGATGVAIHFPANINEFTAQGQDAAYVEQVGEFMGGWINFLNTFYGVAVETFNEEDLLIEITEVVPAETAASIWDPPVVVFQTDGQGIVNIEYYVSLVLEDGGEIFVDQSPLTFGYYTADGDYIDEFPEGLSESEFTWNVEMPILTDGTNSVLVLLYIEDDTAVVEGTYYWRDGSSAPAYIVLDLNTQTFQSVWGYESDSAVSEIKPQRGEKFEPTWEFFDSEGNFITEPSGTQLVFGNDAFTYSYQPAPSGDYYFYMYIEDMAGNSNITFTSFTVDNEGLDNNYRGFKDIQTGLNFLYPWTWLYPDVTQYDDGTYGLQTSDPTGEISILVDYYYEFTSSEEVRDQAVANLEGFGATLMNDPQPLEVGGYPGYYVDYQYTNDSGQRFGSQVVVYVPDTGIGYIIDVDTAEARFDEAVQVLSDVVNSIYFFTPVSVGVE